MIYENLSKKWEDLLRVKSNKDHILSVCNSLKGWCIKKQGSAGSIHSGFDSMESAAKFAQENYQNSWIYLHDNSGTVVKKIET